MTVQREPRDGARSSTAATRATSSAGSTACYDLFPGLAERRRELASTLSGGQQQMLALAMVLLHDPEVLPSTSCRSGSRRSSCRSCSAVVERLKAEGMTIIIVEQSLNVALSIADRAVFLEKGQVRFERSGGRARRARRPRPRRVPRDRGRLIAVVVATWSPRSWSSTASSTGLIIGLLAMGIVLIYRSTRVINFAVGNMGLVGASLLVLLVVKYGVPFWLAAIVALVVGTLFGAIMELVVVRRLFYAPRVIMLVATIGIAGLVAGDRHRLSGPRRTAARRIPSPSTRRGTTSPASGSRGAQLAVLVVVPIVAVALGVVPQPHARRPHGQGVGREPRPRAGAGHQPEGGLDRRVGDRRVRRDAHDDPHRGRRPAPRTTLRRSARTRSCARSSPR